jgi:hypothetical protein
MRLACTVALAVWSAVIDFRILYVAYPHWEDLLTDIKTLFIAQYIAAISNSPRNVNLVKSFYLSVLAVRSTSMTHKFIRSDDRSTDLANPP